MRWLLIWTETAKDEEGMFKEKSFKWTERIFIIISFFVSTFWVLFYWEEAGLNNILFVWSSFGFFVQWFIAGILERSLAPQNTSRPGTARRGPA